MVITGKFLVTDEYGIEIFRLALPNIIPEEQFTIIEMNIVGSPPS